MAYQQHYDTLCGFDDLAMSPDGEVLTGLWFDGAWDGIANAEKSGHCRGSTVDLS